MYPVLPPYVLLRALSSALLREAPRVASVATQFFLFMQPAIAVVSAGEWLHTRVVAPGGARAQGGSLPLLLRVRARFAAEKRWRGDGEERRCRVPERDKRAAVCARRLCCFCHAAFADGAGGAPRSVRYRRCARRARAARSFIFERDVIPASLHR